MAAATGYVTWRNVAWFLMTGKLAIAGTTPTTAETFGAGKLITKSDWPASQAEAEKEGAQVAATVGNLVPDPTELPDLSFTAESVQASVAGRDQRHNKALGFSPGDWTPQFLLRVDSAAHNRINNLANGAAVTIGLGVRTADTKQSVIVMEAELNFKSPVFPSDEFVRQNFAFTINKVYDGWIAGPDQALT